MPFVKKRFNFPIYVEPENMNLLSLSPQKLEARIFDK